MPAALASAVDAPGVALPLEFPGVGYPLWGGDAARSAGAEPASRTATAALVVEGVSLSFGGVRALTDVNLTVAAGEIRAVIGPNGAGKSSLINVVSGLYQPDSGRVRLNGADFAHVPTDRLAVLGVARTFQNLALFAGLSVLDNVAMGLAHQVRAGFFAQLLHTPAQRREQARHRAEAEAVIDFFGLSPFRDRLAGGLPYGVQKRVELARALVARPKLLLLDEPLAGMTAADKQDMAEHIVAARSAFGAAIVLIEHDIGLVMSISDRVAVLDYGRKIADGSPAAVQRDQAVIDAYLGVAHDADPGVTPDAAQHPDGGA